MHITFNCVNLHVNQIHRRNYQGILVSIMISSWICIQVNVLHCYFSGADYVKVSASNFFCVITLYMKIGTHRQSLVWVGERRNNVTSSLFCWALIQNDRCVSVYHKYCKEIQTSSCSKNKKNPKNFYIDYSCVTQWVVMTDPCYITMGCKFS